MLEAWKREVEKKPPEMSVDQAYDALGLETGVGGWVKMHVDILCAEMEGERLKEWTMENTKSTEDTEKEEDSRKARKEEEGTTIGAVGAN